MFAASVRQVSTTTVAENRGVTASIGRRKMADRWNCGDTLILVDDTPVRVVGARKNPSGVVTWDVMTGKGHMLEVFTRGSNRACRVAPLWRNR